MNSRNIKIANSKSQKFERLMVLTKLRDRVLIHKNRDNLFADAGTEIHRRILRNLKKGKVA